jgi:tRNA (guanosine-2'-O-)-methyltransferase
MRQNKQVYTRASERKQVEKVAEPAGQRMEQRPGDVFDRCVQEMGIEGVREILEPWVSANRRDRLEQVLERRLSGVTVVLVGLHDPHNGAAVLRTAEALGVQHVHAVQANEPYRYSPKVTIGCEQWMTIHRYEEFESCRCALKERKYELWAAMPGLEPRAEPPPDDRPVALLFGNEREGLDEEVVEQCTGQFSLPMWGFTRSYNLSVSAALAMAEACRRFRAFAGRPGDLSPEEKARLRVLWLFRSVRAAPTLLARAAEKRFQGSKG